MFAGGFSHTKFSLRGGAEPDARIDVFFLETAGSLVAIKQNSAIENNFRCNVGSHTILTRGFRFVNTFREAVQTTIAGVRDFEIRARYRERGQADAVPVNIDSVIDNKFVENTGFTACVGIDFEYEQRFYEELAQKIQAWRDFPAEIDFTEEMSKDITPSVFVSMAAHFREVIKAEPLISNNALIESFFSEGIFSAMSFGNDLPFEQHFRDVIGALILGSKDLPFEQHFTESVFMTSMATMVEKETLVINVTIPANGVLRIDSETFTVTLNNVSILHNHSGGWINLDRDALEMAISSSRTLNGELIYVERFL